MNRGMVKYIVGRILVVVAILMIPSLFVALIYREGWEGIKPFIISILITGGIGLIMGYKRPQRTDYYAKEGFVIVSLAWLLLSFFGSLPFLLSGSILHPIEAQGVSWLWRLLPLWVSIFCTLLRMRKWST